MMPVTNEAAEDLTLVGDILDTAVSRSACGFVRHCHPVTSAGVLELSCCSLFKLTFSELQIRRSLRHIFSDNVVATPGALFR